MTIAEYDIVCYKVLLDVGGEHYVTPYMKYGVCVPCVIKADCADADLQLFNDDISDTVYAVKGEGVHAWCLMVEAIQTAEIEQGRTLSKVVVAKCVVPKGTGYWVGIGGDIAAREMRIEKIVWQANK